MDLTASSFRERLVNSVMSRISAFFCFWILPISISALEHKVRLFCKEYLLLSEQRFGELNHFRLPSKRCSGIVDEEAFAVLVTACDVADSGCPQQQKKK